jgi:hypothetical protein
VTLDHGRRAQTVPHVDQKRRARLEAELKACREAAGRAGAVKSSRLASPAGGMAGADLAPIDAERRAPQGGAISEVRNCEITRSTNVIGFQPHSTTR